MKRKNILLDADIHASLKARASKNKISLIQELTNVLKNSLEETGDLVESE